jgi:hypothetical protein
LPIIKLSTSDGNACSWLHVRDTFEALIFKNKTLSNVRRFHYLISSLKDEAKDLISNLQITNYEFPVAWQLVSQCYNNIKLIVMKHVKYLCQMPQTKKGDASSLHSLINHASSNMNALQALSLNVPIQDLILKHLMLFTLGADTQKEWELHMAHQKNARHWSCCRMLRYQRQLLLLHYPHSMLVPRSVNLHVVT